MRILISVANSVASTPSGHSLAAKTKMGMNEACMISDIWLLCVRNICAAILVDRLKTGDLCSHGAGLTALDLYCAQSAMLRSP